MEFSHNVPKEKSKENDIAKISPIIENIKNKYILSKIYDNIPKKKKLAIVRFNKRMQIKLNLNAEDYKEYCEIEIEIIPTKGKYGKFIYIKPKKISNYIVLSKTKWSPVSMHP